MQPLSLARDYVRAGRYSDAESLIHGLVEELFPLKLSKVEIRKDGYSLNSVNGFLTSVSGEIYFFKFHQEEGEEETIQEYYRAKILEDAGFSVDSPCFASHEVGKQLLIYHARTMPRFADSCKEYETEPLKELTPLIQAQEKLDQEVCALYLNSLHHASYQEIEQESLFRLFYHRLVDHDGDHVMGSRAARFYRGQQIAINQTTSISFEQFETLTWRINGITYANNLHEIFTKAMDVLAPRHFFDQPCVIAHGDAHNANVWYDERTTPPTLTYFDPAFAGLHIPALLAEIKPCFHNIFAHPLWLYHPDEAEKLFHVSATIEGTTIVVEHDWELSPLRQAFLTSKTTYLWKPLLQQLRNNGQLAEDYEDIIRAAMFACPTLVMNLRPFADKHNLTTGMLGFAIAVILGSRPNLGAHDMITDWFNQLH